MRIRSAILAEFELPQKLAVAVHHGHPVKHMKFHVWGMQFSSMTTVISDSADGLRFHWTVDNLKSKSSSEIKRTTCE